MARRNSRNAAGKVALCGVLGALAVVLMLAGEIIPFATFCCPVLVMFLLIPVMQECGRKMGWVWYVAVCLLSILFTMSNPEATLIFVFLGYYPLIRAYFARIRPAFFRTGVKLLYFNGAVALAYGLMIAVLKLDAVMQEFQESAAWMLVLMILLANVCFLLVERVLMGFEVLYIVKIRRLLHLQ